MKFTTEQLEHKSLMLQYVRGSGRRKIGVVIGGDPAIYGDEPLGWSLCSPTNKHDEFDAGRAIDIAYGRLVKGASDEMPHSVEKVARRMKSRIEKRFGSSIQGEPGSRFPLLDEIQKLSRMGWDKVPGPPDPPRGERFNEVG